MRVIASFFLRAKHWQIFFLIFVMLTVGEFGAIAVIPARIRSWHDLEPRGFFFLWVIAVSFLCFLAWFGSMGLFLRSIVKPTLRLETQFFHFALVFPAVYLPMFFLLVIPDAGVSEGVILPLHLGCMVCLFYLLYFVSKSLVLAETGKQASFYEYAGPFFLLWFFPLGVWIVQPRVNRLYAERSGNGPLTDASVAES